MRRALLSILILPALALGFAGCGGDDEPVSTPVACLGEPETWLTALAEAPGEVKLAGETPISDCLPADQPAGAQTNVGQTAVEVATTLSARMSKPTAGDAPAIQAGYLVGAVERASKESEGINATLLDRVEAAATNGLGRGQELQGSYQQGYEAGRESG